jgi:SAM-dependent methyltransferase
MAAAQLAQRFTLTAGGAAT